MMESGYCYLRIKKKIDIPNFRETHQVDFLPYITRSLSRSVPAWYRRSVGAWSLSLTGEIRSTYSGRIRPAKGVKKGLTLREALNEVSQTLTEILCTSS